MAPLWVKKWETKFHKSLEFENKAQSWWRHQMETFSALLAICARNSPVTGEFPAQRPVTWSFDVFFDLCLIKQLSKQWWGWWFEMPLPPLWHHCNGLASYLTQDSWWKTGPDIATMRPCTVIWKKTSVIFLRYFGSLSLIRRLNVTVM